MRSWVEVLLVHPDDEGGRRRSDNYFHFVVLRKLKRHSSRCHLIFDVFNAAVHGSGRHSPGLSQPGTQVMAHPMLGLSWEDYIRHLM